MKIFYILIFMICFQSCYHGLKRHKPSHHLFSHGHSKGKVDKKLKEVSGMVSSIRNPGMLWAVNDSGNEAVLYLIDDHAKIVMTCHINATNQDWEELAIYFDSVSRKSFLYVGDIGDNLATRETKKIYWFEEPLFDSPDKNIPSYDSMSIKLPDGSRDMESMFIDPLSKDLFLFSKREDSVRLYAVSFPFGKTQKAKKISTLPFTQIVSSDISPDGSEIVIKDYKNVYYWQRNANEPILKTVQQKPLLLPYRREMQGESICFSHDTKGYYTISESPLCRAKLYYYSRK